MSLGQVLAVGERPAQQHSGQLVDEIAAFRDANEDVRRDSAEYRAVPSGERLEGDGLAALDVDDGLKVE